MLHILAQGLDVLVSDEDYFEMLIWGILFVFVIIGLFILNRFLKVGAEGRIKSQMTPFAMSPDDLDKLKKKGALTEEELKKVRESMARKFVERAKEEEETRQKPADAAILLAAEEERILHGEQKEPAPPQPKAEPGKREPLKRMPAKTSPEDKLPERLKPMLKKSDLELEELRAAGFLDEADLQILEELRRERNV